jgi:hypothetical protein
VQHVDERGAAVDGDGEALRETGDARDAGAPGERVEGESHRGAGADVGDDATELVRERAVAHLHDALEPGDGALARGDGQREEVRDDGELLLHPLLPRADGPGQVRVAPEHAEHEPDSAHDEQQRHRRSPRRPQRDGHADTHDQAGATPGDLTQPEVLDGRRRPEPHEPPGHARRAAQQVAHPAAEALDGRREQRAEHAVRRRCRLRVHVADVRQHALLERRAAGVQPSGRRQQDARREAEAQQRAGHARIRRSVGRRPIHIIRR